MSSAQGLHRSCVIRVHPCATGLPLPRTALAPRLIATELRAALLCFPTRMPRQWFGPCCLAWPTLWPAWVAQGAKQSSNSMMAASLMRTWAGDPRAATHPRCRLQTTSSGTVRIEGTTWWLPPWSPFKWWCARLMWRTVDIAMCFFKVVRSEPASASSWPPRSGVAACQLTCLTWSGPTGGTSRLPSLESTVQSSSQPCPFTPKKSTQRSWSPSCL